MSVVGHQPPPFFKRGPAPLAQLAFFVVFSVALLVLDLRFRYLETARTVAAAMLYPAQRAAYAPIELLFGAGNHFADIRRLQAENRELKRREVEVAAAMVRQEQLDLENRRLRVLLDMKQRQPVTSVVAEVLYGTSDPFSRRVVIDKGLQQQVAAGQAVIDEAGLVGQVTRAYPLMSEVTLISDKNQAVPVQVLRNGLRAVVFGAGDGQLELRFLPVSVDVQPGDVLVTSGLDGVFLSGLPVASVMKVDRDPAYTFARILCAPIGGAEQNSLVLVLGPREPLPDLPPAPSGATDKPDKAAVASKKE